MILHWNQALHSLRTVDGPAPFAGAADTGDLGDLWRFESEQRALKASGSPVARPGRVAGKRAAMQAASRWLVVCSVFLAVV